jgi:hypothetical protein
MHYRPAIQEWTKDSLINKYGEMRVHASSIPYANKFGGAGEADMLLSEYINDMRGHRLQGGSHPWYVFKGHPIPRESDLKTSVVREEFVPTPKAIQEAFSGIPGAPGHGRADLFVNAQWAVGGEGTGAPVHFHNTAWNALVYGAKKWLIYPPHYMLMSNKQVIIS